MFTDPDGLAEVVRDGGQQGWDVATELFAAVIDFLKQL